MTLSDERKSKVTCYLVGAGPGNIQLLTLQAKEILESADVVIYDHLIPEAALNFAPLHAKLINAGKVRAKKVTQKEINQILIEECNRLKALPGSHSHKVVRLKGGDPFIFARSSEELDLLNQHEIPFELVPGISSFYAVPEYAGIPLTMRKVSRSFSVITGHFLTEEERNKAIISYSDTVVYLMGIKNLEKIVTSNLKAGKSLDTPMAIIQDGTLARQKTILTNLKNAVKDRDANQITHPGIVIIGEVVKWRHQYSWFEKKPLYQKKIGILRHRYELPKLTQLLEAEGAEVVSIPVMSCVSISKFHQALIDCLKNGWGEHLLFTSSYSVDCFMKAIFSHGYDLRLLGNLSLIAVGEGTNETLKKYHLTADHIPQISSQNGLWTLIQTKNLNHIIFPRALVVRKYLEIQMQENGVCFKPFILYQNQEFKTTNEEEQQVRIDHLSTLDFLLFTSSRVIEFLLRNEEARKVIWPRTISLGEVTYKTLEARFEKFPQLKSNSFLATSPSFDRMVEKIKEIVREDSKINQHSKSSTNPS